MSIELVINEKIKQTGKSRLEIISNLNLGDRSASARKALDKRFRRKELMEYGYSFEVACLIVNSEYNAN